VGVFYVVFCTECGKENEEDAKYCSECGNTLDRPDKVTEPVEIEKKEKVKVTETTKNRSPLVYIAIAIGIIFVILAIIKMSILI
jgi:uncharacterized membrane protein YvbJ